MQIYMVGFDKDTTQILSDMLNISIKTLNVKDFIKEVLEKKESILKLKEDILLINNDLYPYSNMFGKSLAEIVSNNTLCGLVVLVKPWHSYNSICDCDFQIPDLLNPGAWFPDPKKWTKPRNMKIHTRTDVLEERVHS